MTYTIRKHDEIKVIGIPVRTSNAPGEGDVAIPAHWERFSQEAIAEKIPNRLGQAVIGLYTDYEQGFEHPYTLIIGCPVNNIECVPEGMVAKIVPVANYAVFPVTGDAFPQSLIQTWQKIWQTKLNYTFTNCFEWYSGQMIDGVPEIEVYMAVGDPSII